MQYGVSIRSYKCMYFVEFNNKSVGATLLATWDKEQAEDEYNKVMSMNASDRKKYILGK